MSLLRWAWFIASLALISTGCAAQTPGPASGDDCISAKDGVSYAYVWNDAEVSITLSPINESGVRCDDVTVSLVGWEPTSYPARWPQRVVTTRTITLTKDSDVPVLARIKSMCQNDAYWGEAPEVGHINTAGGVPWQETFVNHKLPHGTGANFAADPMTGGLTANTGPCGPSGSGDTTSSPSSTCGASVSPSTSVPSTKGPLEIKDQQQESPKNEAEAGDSDFAGTLATEMTKGPVESPTTDTPEPSDCVPVTPTCSASPADPPTKGIDVSDPVATSSPSTTSEPSDVTPLVGVATDDPASCDPEPTEPPECVKDADGPDCLPEPTGGVEETWPTRP